MELRFCRECPHSLGRSATRWVCAEKHQARRLRASPQLRVPSHRTAGDSSRSSKGRHPSRGTLLETSGRRLAPDRTGEGAPEGRPCPGGTEEPEAQHRGREGAAHRGREGARKAAQREHRGLSGPGCGFTPISGGQTGRSVPAAASANELRAPVRPPAPPEALGLLGGGGPVGK